MKKSFINFYASFVCFLSVAPIAVSILNPSVKTLSWTNEFNSDWLGIFLGVISVGIYYGILFVILIHLFLLRFSNKREGLSKEGVKMWVASISTIILIIGFVTPVILSVLPH